MADPKIVFCSNNHIYDQSIHVECPYCSKIAENQRVLSGLMYDAKIIKEEIDCEDEHTELLRVSPVLCVENEGDEEDHTELLRIHDSNEDEENDYTELIRRNDNSAVHSITTHIDNGLDNDIKKLEKPYVIGWIVCKDGIQKGRSFEIVEGRNYIYYTKGEIVISPVINDKEQEVGEIFKEKKSGDFVLKPSVKGGGIANNYNLQEPFVLKPYDTVVLAGHSCIFVELISEFVEWGI